MQKAPGKAHREGISMIELAEMFPSEHAAVKWFESIIWKAGRYCPRCGSLSTSVKKSGKPMPYRCKDCRKHFSIRTGNVLERSHISLRKWAWGIYLWTTSLKGVSSMKLHRDLKISQKSVWFMAHRLRESFAGDLDLFEGPVEADETYFGGRRRNMKKSQRESLTGRGTVDKVAVVGVKDRSTNRVSAQVVKDTTGETLGGFVMENVVPGTMIYTDEATAYSHLPNHESVKHSVAEYVRGQVHTQGIESFWSMLKRAHKGTFHKLSPKHLQRYVNEFAGRHNIRNWDTRNQMAVIVAAMLGQRLTYGQLTERSLAQASPATSH